MFSLLGIAPGAVFQASYNGVLSFGFGGTNACATARTLVWKFLTDLCRSCTTPFPACWRWCRRCCPFVPNAGVSADRRGDCTDPHILYCLNLQHFELLFISNVPLKLLGFRNLAKTGLAIINAL